MNNVKLYLIQNVYVYLSNRSKWFYDSTVYDTLVRGNKGNTINRVSNGITAFYNHKNSQWLIYRTSGVFSYRASKPRGVYRYEQYRCVSHIFLSKRARALHDSPIIIFTRRNLQIIFFKNLPGSWYSMFLVLLRWSYQ